MTGDFSLSPGGLRVLVVNDDGIDSAGLALLERAARTLSDDVWTVAPRENQSARGRAYSLRQPVACRRLAERRYAVAGTPVDCVLAGLNGLLPGRRPELVLSGVNQGTNLGEDIPASGTVGACLEAAEQGVPGIAFSQLGASRGSGAEAWACAETHLPALLPELLAALDHPETVLNVNFPSIDGSGAIAGPSAVPAGRRKGPVTVESHSDDGNGGATFVYDRLRADEPHKPSWAPACDIELAHAGHITVTPLTRDPTHDGQLRALQSRFGGESGSRPD